MVKNKHFRVAELRNGAATLVWRRHVRSSDERPGTTFRGKKPRNLLPQCILPKSNPLSCTMTKMQKFVLKFSTISAFLLACEIIVKLLICVCKPYIPEEAKSEQTRVPLGITGSKLDDPLRTIGFQS